MVPRAALTASDPIGARSRCSSAGHSGAGSCSPDPGESLRWLRGSGCGSMGAAVNKRCRPHVSSAGAGGRWLLARRGHGKGDGDAVAPRGCGCALPDPARICCRVVWEAGGCRRGASQHPQGAEIPLLVPQGRRGGLLGKSVGSVVGLTRDRGLCPPGDSEKIKCIKMSFSPPVPRKQSLAGESSRCCSLFPISL